MYTHVIYAAAVWPFITVRTLFSTRVRRTRGLYARGSACHSNCFHLPYNIIAVAALFSNGSFFFFFLSSLRFLVRLFAITSSGPPPIFSLSLRPRTDVRVLLVSVPTHTRARGRRGERSFLQVAVFHYTRVLFCLYNIYTAQHKRVIYLQYT